MIAGNRLGARYKAAQSSAALLDLHRPSSYGFLVAHRNDNTPAFARPALTACMPLALGLAAGFVSLGSAKAAASSLISSATATQALAEAGHAPSTLGDTSGDHKPLMAAGHALPMSIALHQQGHARFGVDLRSPTDRLGATVNKCPVGQVRFPEGAQPVLTRPHPTFTSLHVLFCTWLA